jgi:hypothetical protein
LKRNEVNVFESSAIHGLAKHNCLSRLHPQNNRRIKVNRESGVRQWPRWFRGVEKSALQGWKERLPEWEFSSVQQVAPAYGLA